MAEYSMKTPLKPEDVDKLRAGDKVNLNGFIYTARDAAHKKLVELLKEGKPLPLPLDGQIIYYVGPSPTPPGKAIGSAGPTTSFRMDPYAPLLIERGLARDDREGGARRRGRRGDAEIRRGVFRRDGRRRGALSRSASRRPRSSHIRSSGRRRSTRLTVENFPVIVAQDRYGGNIYKEGQKQYAR